MNAHVSISAEATPFTADEIFRSETADSNDDRESWFVDIDGINVLNTPLAIAEHQKNVATPHRFEVGDLIDIHFTLRGHYEAVVVDRHLFAPGPSGGRAVTLLFYPDGEWHLITLSEQGKSLELLKSGYWSKEDVASFYNPDLVS